MVTRMKFVYKLFRLSRLKISPSINSLLEERSEIKSYT